MNKPILTFRHGEPVKGVQKCCRGAGSDCELSPHGLWQTERNIDYLVDRFGNDVRDAIVVTTGMRRTDAFGALLSEEGVHHEVDPDLKAIDAGEWEGMPWEEIRRRWPEQFAHCTEDGESLVVPGGESITAFRERVLRGWQKWIHEQCSALIIVSHDSPNGIINHHVEGHPKLNLRGQTVGGMHEYVMDSEGSVKMVARDVIPYALYEQNNIPDAVDAPQ